MYAIELIVQGQYICIITLIDCGLWKDIILQILYKSYWLIGASAVYIYCVLDAMENVSYCWYLPHWMPSAFSSILLHCRVVRLLITQANEYHTGSPLQYDQCNWMKLSQHKQLNRTQDALAQYQDSSEIGNRLGSIQWILASFFLPVLDHIFN